MAAIKNTTVQRLLLALLPTMVIAGIVAGTIWGDHGLLARYELRQQMADRRSSLAAVERDNQRLQWQLELMQSDPVVMERLVAEELAWGREGATIYRFVDEDER